MSLRSRIRGSHAYLSVRVATAAQFLTLRLVPLGSTHVGCDDSDGPGHAPRYLDVSQIIMTITKNGKFRQGNKTTEWLKSIGIDNIREVDRIGIIEVCSLLRKAGYPVSLNMAYGLKADMMGTTWNRLPDTVKDEMRTLYQQRFG